jgi:fibronectin type 3 domain-containing protein
MLTHTRSALRSAFLPVTFALALAGCGDAQEDRLASSSLRLEAPSKTTQDEFNTTALGQGWTAYDGYADALPNDVENHAAFAVTGSHLSITIPEGAEHNMWWFRHAQVTRDYEGSGVYEIKMDTGLGNEQFGLVFESDPGTFLIFMLYGHNELWGYAERFVTVDNETHKTTFPGSSTNGHNTGLFVPDAGPYSLRVTLRDAVDPSERFWKFQWSKDGKSWMTVVSGALETTDPTENIGPIQRVGVFAGNQPPSPFSGIAAQFDHYKVYPVELSGHGGDGQVQLEWFPVANADGYRVYRSATDGGPYTLVGTVGAPGFVDQGLTNGVPQYYVVTSYDEGPAVGYSAQVKVVPRTLPAPPEELPVVGGLTLMLDASSIEGLVDDDPVEEWVDSSGTGHIATAIGSAMPTFSSDGLYGKPAVYFDGVDDYLSLAAGFEDFTDGVTIFAVVRPTELQSGFKLLALGNGPGKENVVFGRAGTGAGLLYFTNNTSGSYGWFSTADALAADTVSFLGMSQPGGAANSTVTARVTANGVEVGSGSVYVPPVVTRATNFVGRSYWQDGRFEGYLAELLVYDRELSASERSAVQTYLQEKYPEPLVPPPALTAEPDGDRIAVSWGEVNSASEYIVYRAGAAGGPYQAIGTTAATSYVDLAVTAGSTYYYQVSSSNGAEETEVSGPVNATVPVLPEGLPAQGLALFLRADTLGLSDGASVSSWTDESLRGNDATAFGPTFSASGLNGQPAVEFDGVNDHFTLPAGFADFTAGVSLFIVAQPTEYQQGAKFLAIGNDGGGDSLALGRAGATAGLQYFTTNSSNWFGWFNTNSGLETNQAAVFGVHHGGGTVDSTVSAQITVDGVSVGGGSVYVPPVKQRAFNYIGKSYWSDGYFEGRISEILLYRRQLSAGEREAVQAYLGEKYAPPLSPPSASAAPDDGAIVIHWDAVDHAEEYVVARSGSAGGSYQTLGTTSAASYVDDTAEQGQTYYYRVTAIDGNRQSEPSAPVSAQVPVLPEGLPAQGLLLFLSADTLGLGNGSPVSSWSDGSGRGNDATASGGPVFSASGFNGQPAVVFDGVNDHFTLPAGFSDFTSGMSLFVVAEPTTLQSGFKLVVLGNSGGLDSMGLGRAGTSSGLQFFNTDASNSFGWFDTSSGLASNVQAVFAVHQAGGSANSTVSAAITVDGASVGGGSVYVPPIKTRSLNYIGKSYWSDGYFQGSIAEVVLYKRLLSASEQAGVQAYLAAKYDL